MAFRVVLSPEAKDDIIDIYRYVAIHDSIANAEKLLTALEAACHRFADFPERNNRPKELLGLGVDEFREAHCGPYRIVYGIDGRRVDVLCVLDGRRDMQALLQRRLLG